MELTQDIIDQIQEAMLHTKKDGSINWKDGDEIEEKKSKLECLLAEVETADDDCESCKI